MTSINVAFAQPNLLFASAIISALHFIQNGGSVHNMLPMFCTYAGSVRGQGNFSTNVPTLDFTRQAAQSRAIDDCTGATPLAPATGSIPITVEPFDFTVETNNDAAVIYQPQHWATLAGGDAMMAQVQGAFIQRGQLITKGLWSSLTAPSLPSSGAAATPAFIYDAQTRMITNGVVSKSMPGTGLPRPMFHMVMQSDKAAELLRSYRFESGWAQFSPVTENVQGAAGFGLLGFFNNNIALWSFNDMPTAANGNPIGAVFGSDWALWKDGLPNEMYMQIMNVLQGGLSGTMSSVDPSMVEVFKRTAINPQTNTLMQVGEFLGILGDSLKGIDVFWVMNRSSNNANCLAMNGNAWIGASESESIRSAPFNVA